MTHQNSPFTHAFAAFGYITALVSTVYLSSFVIVEETIFIPIGVLSALVFSVALMAYLFFSRPLILLLEGKREEGVRFFLHTLGAFAAIVLVGVGAGLFLVQILA